MAYEFAEAIARQAEEYRRSLLEQDPEKRRQWLEGTWDITEAAPVSEKAWRELPVRTVLTREGQELPLGHACRTGCGL